MNFTDRISYIFGWRLPPLPDDFLFGVATADHQCEAYDPAHEDIRDVWERQRQLTARGMATDFERNYPTDIENAQKLGCKLFRFSIAWSRVEPEPDTFDETVLNYYRQLIGSMRAMGMEPVLTLHHFTWPIHIEQRGGLLSDDFPMLFCNYVRRVVEALGEDVRFWITFNEPSQLVYGFVKPPWSANYFMPPGLPAGSDGRTQMDAVATMIRNVFLAHTRARDIIRARCPAALVGTNPMVLGLPGWLQQFINRKAFRHR